MSLWSLHPRADASPPPSGAATAANSAIVWCSNSNSGVSRNPSSFALVMTCRLWIEAPPRSRSCHRRPLYRCQAPEPKSWPVVPLSGYGVARRPLPVSGVSSRGQVVPYGSLFHLSSMAVSQVSRKQKESCSWATFPSRSSAMLQRRDQPSPLSRQEQDMRRGACCPVYPHEPPPQLL